MANQDALRTIRMGIETWNRWRETQVDAKVLSLTHADLSGRDLSLANFSRMDMRWMGLRGTDCFKCNFAEADLMGANLRQANLTQANLQRADLRWCHLIETNFREADLRDALLQGAILLRADLRGANLSGARIFGISAWDIIIDQSTSQSDLIVNPYDAPTITVDNVQVAQFIYLLLNNDSIRGVIDTITSKVVLIIGRFTPERKVVLDAIRDELRKRDYLPILFDFDKPANKDLTGTVQTLANMARFVIADITSPSCVPHELGMIIPGTPVPVQPIIQVGQVEYSMFVDLRMRYAWVLKPFYYASTDELIKSLGQKVIAPAESKFRKIRR